MSAVSHGEASFTWLRISLTDVIVTHVASAASAPDDRAEDQVGLGFGTVVVEKFSQAPDGSVGEPVTFAWDVRRNGAPQQPKAPKEAKPAKEPKPSKSERKAAKRARRAAAVEAAAAAQAASLADPGDETAVAEDTHRRVSRAGGRSPSERLAAG